MAITETQLIAKGLAKEDAQKIVTMPTLSWEQIKKEILCKQYPSPYSFVVHQFLYNLIYPKWQEIPSPTFFPSEKSIASTHLHKMMQEKGFSSYPELHAWSVQNMPDFLATMLNLLNIQLKKPFNNLVSLSEGFENPIWLQDASLNIVESCFTAEKNNIAIISQAENGEIKTITYQELESLSHRVAMSLSALMNKGEKVAIIMPMTSLACAIYLGAIEAGMVVVSIPDSFAAEEIAKRLEIADVTLIFTQDVVLRDKKTLALYEKIKEANAPLTVVLPHAQPANIPLRVQDILWQDFLSSPTTFEAITCSPSDFINILFSSGTTGTPKAIPWTHTTPIKCASDAYLHMDLKPGDIFCWPTGLGWMMGPWLIFASLINKATIALYDGTPNDRRFGEFIQNIKVTHLGVVPTLVRTWRNSQCMAGLNWQHIKLFASTGEVSNVEDMFYLMHLVNYKPIIEYCGGTEIGGAYITSTLIEPNAPSTFTTPAMGLDFVILNEEGQPANTGEVAILGPAIGLSTTLLNKDHHAEYFENMPRFQDKKLRRHGDEIKQFENGYFRLLGRADDTLKLGGIKISSAEIEAVLNPLEGVLETAAIGVSPQDGGPSQLVIYAVLKTQAPDLAALTISMQNAIKQHLSPLFKIHEVIKVDELPRTPSNKIMRRVLKNQYSKLQIKFD